VAGDGRRPGELNVKELLRWGWRQLTSMRTALLLLLLLAVAAIPGSIIPQNGVDSLKASQWRDAHPSLTPVYEKLGLFHVFSTPWFAAIYLLLLISLVGCFIPRIVVYAKALRARPHAPRATSTACRRTRSSSPTAAPARCSIARTSYSRATGASAPATRSAPSGATSARAATCSSTSPCWSCWSASR
jgi:cytochrome c biogenesis protein